MAHTITNKTKLIGRVRRIKGQVQALERALDNEHDCSLVLQQIAACRGAMNGLMAEVVEGHIRSHLMAGHGKEEDQMRAAQGLIDLVQSYLK